MCAGVISQKRIWSATVRSTDTSKRSVPCMSPRPTTLLGCLSWCRQCKHAAILPKTLLTRCHPASHSMLRASQVLEEPRVTALKFPNAVYNSCMFNLSLIPWGQVSLSWLLLTAGKSLRSVSSRFEGTICRGTIVLAKPTFGQHSFGVVHLQSLLVSAHFYP